MNIKKLYSIVMIFLFLMLPVTVVAQEIGDNLEAPEVESTESNAVDGETLEGEEDVLGVDTFTVQAAIESADSVEIGKNIIFSAANSTVNEVDDVRYVWNLGDGTIIEGEEVVHSYAQPGQYVVSLTTEQNGKKSSIDKYVVAYENIIVLITDKKNTFDKVIGLVEKANAQGVFVNVIENVTTRQGGFVGDDVLVTEMVKNIKDIEKTDTLVFWLENNSDLGVVASFYRENIEKEIDFAEKSFVFITDGNLTSVASFSQNIYNIVQPKQIIITRNKDLDILFESKGINAYIETLETKFDDYVILNESSGGFIGFRFVSELVTYMLERGVSSNTILLILLFPIIATIVAFCRQVIGITTFGVYIPSILSLSFIALSLRFGLIIFLMILVAGTCVRIALSRFRLLSTPKVAIILIASGFFILLSMGIGAYFNIADVATLAVFPMLIMTTLSERFVHIQTEKGFKLALLAMLETLAVSIICYYFVKIQMVQTFALSYPGWMIFILLCVNGFLGRYTGLRITEYVRFREVFKHMEE